MGMICELSRKSTCRLGCVPTRRLVLSGFPDLVVRMHRWPPESSISFSSLRIVRVTLLHVGCCRYGNVGSHWFVDE